MTRTPLFLAAALAAVSLSSAAGAGDFGPSKTSICHRTGQKADGKLFRGNVITVSSNAVGAHVDGHGDVIILEATMKFFASSKACQVDAEGSVYDDRGTLVQPGAPPPPPPPPG